MDDRELAAMIADLRRMNEWFAALRDGFGVGGHVSERKTIRSTLVGEITLDCDVLTAADSDLRVVVYTARSRTEDSDKLDFLRVFAEQSELGHREIYR